MFNRDPDPAWFHDSELDELERLSNGVVDLIESGHLDESHRNCLELKTRFPDQIDWIKRSAAVCEARGQIDQVIDHHRRCLAHIRSNPDGFDSDSRAWYRSQIDRLRKPSTSDGSK